MNNKIHLTNSLFLRLDYEPNQIIDLKYTTNNYCSQVLKLIKDNNIRDYHLLNFLDLVSKKLSEDNKVENLIETQKKVSELIIKKEDEIKSEDIKNKEEYLNMRLTEKNKKFKDLLKL